VTPDRLRVRGLAAAWNDVPVLHGVDLSVGDRELVALLGPNGSGKTTLLRTIAGLEPPTAGTVELDGVDITERPTHRRGIGFLFQEPTLFPGRTVVENVAYGLDLRRRPAPEADARVGELVALLRLQGLEDRRADRLSGGERQRVALARTLAPSPRLVLLDEPLASVDPELRDELRSEFRRVLRAAGVAALYVTHDREEGLFLGDRVVLLWAGRVLEQGEPRALFDRPRTAEAARFLGYNVVGGPDARRAVHPNDVEVLGSDDEGIPATVAGTGPVGRDWLTYLTLDEGTPVAARGPSSPAGVREGDRVRVRWRRSVPVQGATTPVQGRSETAPSPGGRAPTGAPPRPVPPEDGA
jgi:thiamine transport system ATP-binding protein